MNIAVTQSEYFQKDRNLWLPWSRLVCFYKISGLNLSNSQFAHLTIICTNGLKIRGWHDCTILVAETLEKPAVVIISANTYQAGDTAEHSHRDVMEYEYILYFGGSLIAKSGHPTGISLYLMIKTVEWLIVCDFCVDHCPTEFSILAFRDRTIKCAPQKHQILGSVASRREKQFQARFKS